MATLLLATWPFLTALRVDVGDPLPPISPQQLAILYPSRDPFLANPETTSAKNSLKSPSDAPQAPVSWSPPHGVPLRLVAGILRVETRSTLHPDGTVTYRDRRRGSHGERGPTQLRRAAFDMVSKPGEQFWRVETDPAFAVEITCRYLIWCRKQTGSWGAAIRAYNAGPEGWQCPAAGRYLEAVRG